MKKVLTIAMALCVASGMLAACSQRNDSANDSAGAPLGSGKNEGHVSSASGDVKNEKLKINIMVSSWTGGGWPDNNHPIIKYINDKFNVDLQMQWIPNANYAEKLNVIAASGNMPDIIRMDSAAMYLNWVQRGVFLDLAPYLTHYPTLQSVAKPEEWATMDPKGTIHGIPIYVTPQNSIYARADWLENLGIPQPSPDEFTIDKFYEIASAFTKNDPDKNGKADTFGFSALGNAMNLGMPELQAAFGIANGWKEQNGELVPMQVQSQEWKNYLTFMSKAYKEGVLDKDFILNTNFNEKYAEGKVGFADMHYQFSQQTNQKLKAINPEASFVELSPPSGPDGARGTNTPTMGMLKVALTKNVDEKKRDRILKIFDWWVSPEGEDIIKNGIEGVHYEKKDDGTYQMTEALKAEGEGRQSLLWNWVLRGNSNTFNTYKWSDPTWVDGMAKSIENAKKYPYKNAADSYLVSSAVFAEKGSVIGDKFLKTVLEIIAGKKPVDSIDEAIANWKKDGGDQIIEEVNAAYKAAK